ncbi:SH3 domain-containing protein [Tenacibaculum finnmarkense genomovar finnmarkense]|uniref:SH3 domain-containing protein n=1 Tax=Tenacibaculum finnmarkense TaxID=2781243 RepID=UPI001E312885|nr:SH3 domain-containing protein [Tenacibaculum finnmarkense]MCD8418568.1 SH3 domain-containing protein [Tenacibaculum finnmarkense genomovar finnmarkense]MCG8186926.1 SH3 domain-containing protein [Tenacibaculum finnmarkense genomovar finnmarkense]MCG8203474.1 SH3 domain-containing protein [Tenacibaculum finnmarkense genomovar finnmarkense]MCG8210948.1 SH3 domain-containing protein [Tenacibaculum finnmarkense genomovar finnmarkense]MCG8213734.1 SH3 domain-containing protein [Tenacibaculum fin
MLPNTRYGESSLSPDPFNHWGVINDPDGYTNMRDDKNSKSPIKKRILKDEKFGIESDVKNSEEDWWLVRTSEGMRGWVHKSRITIIKNYYFGREKDAKN